MTYQDLHKLPEDDRITLIGERATKGERIAVLLERDEPEKIDRYIRKVTERFPHVRLIAKGPGPVPSVIALQFGISQ